MTKAKASSEVVTEGPAFNRPSLYRTERQVIYDRLKDVDDHEPIRYSELEELTGLDLRGQHRHVLDTVRKWLERDGKLFLAVTKVGLKLATDQERLDYAHQQIARSRRAAKRSVAVAAGTPDDALDDDEAVRKNTILSVAGAGLRVASAAAYKAVETRVRQVQGALPSATALGLFTGGREK